ncbi:MAG: hypothetical protein KJZ78_09060 [Bryobacteraceae bacterium]|nr:hypothetical protein [Bryobacteraceae bacterium]
MPDLTETQKSILWTVAQHERREPGSLVDADDLADYVASSTTEIQREIQGLIGRGLLANAESEEEAPLRLTPAGWKAVQHFEV